MRSDKDALKRHAIAFLVAPVMTDAPRPLVVGNWKMNPRRVEGLALARDLAARVGSASELACEVLVCPPATLLSEVGAVLKGSLVRLGAQDCHASAGGAHTGDISAGMLAELGCGYVIVGHSERRTDHGETDAVVRAKAAAAHRAGLIAIVCIGETERERDAGETLGIVARQLADSLPEGADADNTVIAYEPVWAIGSGRTPTGEEIAEIHAHTLAKLAQRLGAAAAGFRLLYGGSVTPANAAELLSLKNVDGALVGGASLEAEDFWRIIQSSV